MGQEPSSPASELAPDENADSMVKLTVDKALMLATSRQRKGQTNHARAIYNAVLSAFPNNTQALNALANLDNQNEPSSLTPDPPQEQIEALKSLYDQGEMQAVVDRVRVLIRNYQNSFLLWNISGAANAQIGRLEQAINDFRNASNLNPNYPDAHNNLGIALKKQGKICEAIQSYKRALILDPNNAESHNNLGVALQEQGKLDQAITSYKRALLINPNLAHAEAQMLYQRQHICDWAEFAELSVVCKSLGITTSAVPPFLTLSMEDNPSHQMRRSHQFARSHFKDSPPVYFPKLTSKPDRIRIGYFSAEFRDHAMLLLLLGLLREHDSSKFEIFAYGYGGVQANGLSEKAQRQVDCFTDVTTFSDTDIVALARKHKLDIAIDLNGYTGQTRSNIFAHRLAPIQINFLGYPGTMGTDIIDYIVVDPIILPNTQLEFYTESRIFLPNCYFPTDSMHVVAKNKTVRADYGLPEDAIVFCCFNSNYKISPREFDIWMELLDQVDGSVLWLLRSNNWSEENLRKEAITRGINPDRIVFAEKAPHSEHIERHKHADLFLDTFNYNAHTTAADALWAGLPIVTKIGQQLAARVSASMLNAVGLPELITATEQEYKALILDLARNPEKISNIKDKLVKNLSSEPLFDTRRYTRDFELGLQRIFNLYFEEQPPQDIRV